MPHVPANRSVNSRGDGTLFDRTEFTYQPKSDTFLCPAEQTLARKQLAAAPAGLPLDGGESGGNSAASPIIPVELLLSFGGQAWHSSGLCGAVGWALLDYN